MKLGRRAAWIVLLLPALVYTAYLFLPVADSIRMSLNSYSRQGGIRPALTGENYESVFTDASSIGAWLSTLRIALESSLLTVLLGAAVAYGLWRVGGRWRGYLAAIVVAPLFVSGVARAYGWIAIGGPNGPWVQGTHALGLDIPILFNENSVILSFIHTLLPLAVIQVLLRLDAIAPSLPKAAANLGAGQWTVARRVLLPLTYPALASSFLLVFALCTAAYSVPTILGGGRVLTVAQLIYREQTVIFDWPLAAALATTLTAVTLILMAGYQAVGQRWERRARPVIEL